MTDYANLDAGKQLRVDAYIVNNMANPDFIRQYAQLVQNWGNRPDYTPQTAAEEAIRVMRTNLAQRVDSLPPLNSDSITQDRADMRRTINEVRDTVANSVANTPYGAGGVRVEATAEFARTALPAGMRNNSVNLVPLVQGIAEAQRVRTASGLAAEGVNPVMANAAMSIQTSANNDLAEGGAMMNAYNAINGWNEFDRYRNARGGAWWGASDEQKDNGQRDRARGAIREYDQQHPEVNFSDRDVNIMAGRVFDTVRGNNGRGGNGGRQ